jgi:GxxExxY protein
VAIEVHRHLGPGLLESAYEECLCHELDLRGIDFRKFNVSLLTKGIIRSVLYSFFLFAVFSVFL